MRNPADARPVYFYTPDEVNTAKLILSTPEVDKFGSPMCPASWRKWAQKVLTWYGRFRQVLRSYARTLRSLALAQVAIWANIRAGLSVPAMLRQIDHARDLARVPGLTPRTYARDPLTRAEDRRDGPAVVRINPKTQRHRARQTNRNTAHRLQVAASI